MNDAPRIGLSYTGPAHRVRGEGEAREVTINSTDRDRHGTIIDPAGARLDAYRQNPVVLFGHDHTRIVGTSRVRYDEENRRLVARMDRWAEDATDVRRKVENGILRGASVGFRVLDKKHVTDRDGNRVTIVTDWELVEWSWTAVPSNPAALARAGTVERLPEHAVRSLRTGGPAEKPILNVTVRARIGAGGSAGRDQAKDTNPPRDLQGADALRAMHGDRWKLREVNPPKRRGAGFTFGDRSR